MKENQRVTLDCSCGLVLIYLNSDWCSITELRLSVNVLRAPVLSECSVRGSTACFIADGDGFVPQATKILPRLFI